VAFTAFVLVSFQLHTSGHLSDCGHLSDSGH